MCVPSVPGTRPICPVICPFCPGDILSFAHKSGPNVPGVPWDVPSLSLGRLRGIPTAKFLYVIFLYRFFSLHIKWSRKCRLGALKFKCAFRVFSFRGHFWGTKIRLEMHFSRFRKRGLANRVSPFFSEDETEKNGRKQKTLCKKWKSARKRKKTEKIGTRKTAKTEQKKNGENGKKKGKRTERKQENN